MLGECGTKRAMNRPRRNPRPLDSARLEELALHYAGRYATTRARLVRYLTRKIRERGWDGEREPDLAAIAGRFAELGYVDDRAFALAKASAHTARGLGARRLSLSLRSAGVEEADAADAMTLAKCGSVESAIRLAQRRKLGPFATSAPTSPKEREKALATLVRGGHGFDIAKAITDLRPGDEEGLEALRERFSSPAE
jgi:regulatory protein